MNRSGNGCFVGVKRHTTIRRQSSVTSRVVSMHYKKFASDGNTLTLEVPHGFEEDER